MSMNLTDGQEMYFNHIDKDGALLRSDNPFSCRNKSKQTSVFDYRGECEYKPRYFEKGMKQQRLDKGMKACPK